MAWAEGPAVLPLPWLWAPRSPFPRLTARSNRSNFFLTDGLTNYGSLLSTYAVPPIIDAIQEFKVVSHTDDAEFGSVLGGTVNVVTKSGTNEFHGSAWEYIRNNVFDARTYFLPTSAKKAAYHQNQFGGAIGGPVGFPSYTMAATKPSSLAPIRVFAITRPATRP